MMICDELFTIGRDAANHLCIKDSKISSQHAQIKRDGDDAIIQDLSRNGIYINGEKVEMNEQGLKVKVLKHGDQISFKRDDQLDWTQQIAFEFHVIERQES